MSFSVKPDHHLRPCKFIFWPITWFVSELLSKVCREVKCSHLTMIMTSLWMDTIKIVLRVNVLKHSYRQALHINVSKYRYHQALHLKEQSHCRYERCLSWVKQSDDNQWYHFGNYLLTVCVRKQKLVQSALMIYGKWMNWKQTLTIDLANFFLSSHSWKQVKSGGKNMTVSQVCKQHYSSFIHG